MLILFLIKPPAATGQSPIARQSLPVHTTSLAFAAEPTEFTEPQASLAVQESDPGRPARAGLHSTACLGARLAYTALRQLGVAERGVRVCATASLDHIGAMGFTVVAEFINLGPGTCEK